MKKTFILTVLSVLCALSGNATAHSLNLFVHGSGDGTVKGNAYFTGGEPARNLTVRVEDSKGKPLGETTTDAEGNFNYKADTSLGAIKFVVTTEDGHRAAASVQFNMPTPDPATAASTPNNEIAALHEAIQKLENRLWLRDVIGGIGYIFGIAGLWALLKTRRGSSGH